MKLKFILPLFLGILFVSSFVFAKDIQVVTDEGIFIIDSETGEIKSKITSEGYDSNADGIYTGEGDDVYLSIDTNTTLVSKGAGGFLVGSSDSGASRLHVSPIDYVTRGEIMNDLWSSIGVILEGNVQVDEINDWAELAKIKIRFKKDTPISVNRDGLLLYCSFDDDNCIDGKGKEILYSENGDVYRGKNGKFGRSMNFDGDDDYLRLENSDFIEDFNVRYFTLSTWVKFDSLSGSPFLICFYDNSFREAVKIGLNSSNNMRIVANSSTQADSQDQININIWYHISFVYDNKNLYLYINGKLDSTIAYTGTIYDTIFDGFTVFGADKDSTSFNQFFDGSLDEVKIWNRAFSPSEVFDDYNNSSFGVSNFYNDSSYSGITLGDNNIIEKPFDCSYNGVIGLWHFDKDGVIEDSCGNSANGTIVGGASYYKNGKINGAYSFDGVDDYISIPQNETINLSTDHPYSISYWMKVNKLGGYSATVMKGHFSSSYGHLFQGSDSNLIIYTDSDTNPEMNITFLDNSDFSSWIHVLQTYDGNTARVYKNGYLEAEQSGLSLTINTDNLYFGANSGNSYYFNGLLDEIVLFDREIKEDEIWDYYNSGLYTHQIQDGGENLDWKNLETSFDYSVNTLDDGLVGYWGFNQEISDRIEDESDYKNHGDLYVGSDSVYDKFEDGVYGGALKFDGIDDYVEVEMDGQGFSTLNKTYSYNLWMKSDDYSSASSLLSRRYGCNNNHLFNIYTKYNRLYFGYYTSPTTVYHYSGVVLENGKEYNITWVKPFGSLGVKLYINGVSQTVYGDSVINGKSADLMPIIIGAQFSDDACYELPLESYKMRNFFNGSIDEVRIYDRALNQEEIKSLYNIGNTKHYVQIKGINDSEVSTIVKDENWTGIEPIPATYSSDSTNKTLYKEGFDTTKEEYKSKEIGLSLMDGLVGYWNFDKETFPVKDYSGNENNGTNYGAVYTDNAVAGKAMKFDGVNDHIQTNISSNEYFEDGDEFSVSLWIYINSYPTSYSVKTAIIGGNGYNIGGFGIGISDTSINTQVMASGFGIETGYSLSNFPLKNWHYLTMLYTDNYVEFYLNSELLGQTELSTWFTNSIGIKIGQGTQGGWTDGFFDGLIDDVRIYDRALSSDEIKELYYNYSPKELNSGKFLDSINLEQEDKLLFSKAETESEFSLDFENGYLSNTGKKLTTDNLVAYWSFDDFTGGSGVTKDTSGNGNDATIYSTAISRDGILGKSVEIENDYITTNVGLTDSGTISVWINPNFDGGAGVEYPIIDATYSGSRWFSIGMGGGAIGGSNIGFSLEDAEDSDYTASIPSSIIETGNWYNLIGTWAIGSPIKFYLNGELQASSQNLVSFDLDTLGPKIRIGEYSGDYVFYPPYGNFDGKIDEVFVLNRALTVLEVEELYNSKKNLLPDKRIATGEIYGNPVIQGSGVDNLDDVNVKIYSSLEEENKNGFFDPTDGGDSITYYDVIPDLEEDEKITVSFWMKWDGTQTCMPISFSLYNLYLNSGFGFNTGNGDLYGIGNSSTEDQLLNKWAHVVAVFDSEDSLNNLLYINGVLQNLTQIRGTSMYREFGNNIRISGWLDDNNHDFSGELDNVLVFEGALTPDEVNGLYNLTAFSKKEFDSQKYIQDTVCANCDKLIGLNNEVLLDVNFNNNRKIETISQNSISYNKTLIDNFDGVLGVLETRGRYGNGMNFKNNNIITYKNTEISDNYTVSYWMKYTDSDYFSHVVKTYDGNSTKYYVNGEFTNSFLLDFPFYQNGTSLDIGWDGTNYFSGVLDHLKIYDYVLNDSEIENLYYDKFYEREGTLEFWVKPDFNVNSDSEDNRIIFDYSGALDKNPDVNTFRIYKKYDFIEERQEIRFSVFDYLGNEHYVEGPVYWVEDVWHKVAVSWSGLNTINSNISISVDGVLLDNLQTEWIKIDGIGNAFSVFNSNSLEFRENLEKDMIAYWKMDDLTGENTVLSGNTASISAGITSVSGKIDNSVSLDGIDDYINIDSPDYGYSYYGHNTYSLWVKFDDPTVSQTIIAEGDNTAGFELAIIDEELKVGVLDNPGSVFLRYPTKLLKPGSWYNIAFVIDSHSDYFALYIDGQKVDYKSIPLIFSYQGVELASIGKCNGYSPLTSAYVDGRYFAGDIDEVKIWNRALSDSEVNFNYQNTSLGFSGGIDDLMISAYSKNTPESYPLGYDLSKGAVSGVTRDDLFRYWDFDENIDGFSVSGASNVQEGKINGGLFFNGDSYIKTGDIFDHDNYAISLWFNPSSDTDINVIFDNYGDQGLYGETCIAGEYYDGVICKDCYFGSWSPADSTTCYTINNLILGEIHVVRNDALVYRTYFDLDSAINNSLSGDTIYIGPGIYDIEASLPAVMLQVYMDATIVNR